MGAEVCPDEETMILGSCSWWVCCLGTLGAVSTELFQGEKAAPSSLLVIAGHILLSSLAEWAKAQEFRLSLCRSPTTTRGMTTTLQRRWRRRGLQATRTTTTVVATIIRVLCD